MIIKLTRKGDRKEKSNEKEKGEKRQNLTGLQFMACAAVHLHVYKHTPVNRQDRFSTLKE